MEKATIIYGHRESGKKDKAEEIAKQYKHVVRIGIWNRNIRGCQFLFSEVTEETDLIIIDDLRDDYDFEFWGPFIGGEIIVNKKMKAPFTRKTPKLLFIIDKKPISTGASFDRRFDFIECKRPIPAAYLGTGMQFKLPGKRKFRTVAKKHQLGTGDNIPAEHKGKLLVITDECKQFILDKEQEVIILNN